MGAPSTASGAGGRPPRRVVIASGNPGKVREIRHALAGSGLEPVAQGELGIAAPDEPHGTFLENALEKARHAARLGGLPAIADDSGICVDALGGAPGVRSARYAGPDADDAKNLARLLGAMRGVSDRRARYHATLVYVRSWDDPAPVVAQGAWVGEIAPAPRGDGGFGYDPVFFDPALGKTGAEMGIDEKNSVSHRGKSLAALARALREHGVWR